MSGRPAERSPATRQGASNAEAAAFFGVTDRQVTRWRRSGWTVHYPDGSIDLVATATRLPARKDNRGRRPAGRPPVDTPPDAPDGGAPFAGDGPRTPEEAAAASAAAADLPPEARGVSTEESRRRRSYWDSERARLEVARLRGELVPIADAQAVYVDLVAAAKASLEAVPIRVAPRLVGKTSLVEIRQLVAEEIAAALRNLPDDAPPVG